MIKNFVPIFFILLWIVPVAWVGLMRSSYPLYPTWLAPLFRVTGVFENAPPRWRVFFIETQDHNGNWQCVDEATMFAHTPLGNRTRFQTLGGELVDRPDGEALKLLSWIADHHPETSHIPKRPAIRIISYFVPPEFFLKRESLGQVYIECRDAHSPLTVVATLKEQ